MGACAIGGIMRRDGIGIGGSEIVRMLTVMHERANGQGAGYAGYGIYPSLADYYAFHVMFETKEAKEETERCLEANFMIEHDEPIPCKPVLGVPAPALLWRYFLSIRPAALENPEGAGEEDIVVRTVMTINRQIDKAFVFSSGKDMGIFKGLGMPADVARFYRLQEYEGWLWTGHGRFPTNSAGWWGGAHPFGLLDWSVAHNGEISSYGINRRYLENFGYYCTLSTDTEVVTYLFDLLVREHGLSFELAAKVLAAPFWDRIDAMPPEEANVATALRIVYGGALLNGPFAVVVGHRNGMVGLNDRIKLRPLVAATAGAFLYIASEECGILAVNESPEKVWAPGGGVPVIGFRESAEVGSRPRDEQERAAHAHPGVHSISRM